MGSWIVYLLMLYTDLGHFMLVLVLNGAQQSLTGVYRHILVYYMLFCGMLVYRPIPGTKMILRELAKSLRTWHKCLIDNQ